MENITDLTFRTMVQRAAEKYSGKHAMSFVDEEGYSFATALEKMESLVAFYEALGIKQGDRIAVLGVNSPEWVISYLSVTYMGATVVPILHDFTAEEINTILEHSEAKAIIVSENMRSALDKVPSSMDYIISMEDFSMVNDREGLPSYSPAGRPAKDYDVKPDDLAAIIYTSGTTGSSKGVMLSHRNIISNAYMGKDLQYIDDKDRFLSILPLAHTFENTLGMVIPFLSGSSVYYLRKPPTAPVLLPALKKIKPTIMLSVPLIIEKIYFSKIRPAFNKSKIIKTLYKVAPIRKVLNRAAGKKLMETFGGEVVFFGIGGAKVNPEVERFLYEAKFPYAIGYGLTETAPLLAGMVGRRKVESTGPPAMGVEIKLNDPDPVTGEGEIWARGENVMKGYYKNPEKTAEVLTPDGWFRTGDLATQDKDGFIFVKGRLKTVIIGSSGENIYPEEIESVINTFRHVVESLVVEKGGKIVAMVHINREELEEKYRDVKDEMTKVVEERIEEIITELKHQVNQRLNRFSRINQFILQPAPFQKTPTKKIKRYLYI